MQSSNKKISIFDLAFSLPGVIKDLPKISTALYYNFTTNSETPISNGELFYKTVKKYPTNKCLYYQDKSWSYTELNEWINRLAHQFLKLGFNKGDVAVLMLENRPEIIALSMALNKIGCVAALINTSQKNKSLLHSIRLVDPKMILIGTECLDNFSTIKKDLVDVKNRILLVENDNINQPIKYKFPFFDIEALNFSITNPSVTKKIIAKDACLYIYTSGTTGLPKASVISHGRWLKSYCAFGLTSFRLNENDILYVPLPFYHATAMLVCWSSVIAGGASMVIKPKFSVTNFWIDIDKYKATGFGYVGELCKYLLNAPYHTLEEKNTLTKMIGNGLRPDIWQAFKQRFGVNQVAEFYGSSEGNIAFFNVFNLNSTMGFSITSYAIVEYDLHNNAPVLNRNGYMQKVKTNGVGLLLGEINKRYPFDGYTENDKSEKTIFRNVFKKGDAWFNTGDLVRDMGFFHTQFVDRLGDTFRWKGENVSTTEVEAVINQFSGIAENVVYGVEVPENNGRAGMVNIIVDNEKQEIDLIKFYNYLNTELPAYAIPVFLRISTATEITSTYKHQKQQLKEDGFDYKKIGKEVYVLIDKKYTRITKKIFNEIQIGKYRF